MWVWITERMTNYGRFFWLFLAFLVLFATIPGSLPDPAAAASSSSPVATASRLNGDARRVRFVADLSYAISYNVYVLPDPFRVIIDLSEVDFQLPPDSGTARVGFIEGFRYGLVDTGKSRIVLDASGPVLIEKSFAMGARGDQPARIVVDLVATDQASFARVHKADQARAIAAIEEMPPISARAADPKTTGNDDAIAGLLVRPAVPLPRSKPPGELAARDPQRKPAQAPVSRYVIVIDAGHGGIDSGTISKGGVAEKDIVLAFARELKLQLEADKRYHVVMTRNDDRLVTLRKRVKIARDSEADLFIALHADSVGARGVRGATVYTLSERGSDAEADALAQKENRADIIAGVDLAVENDDVTGILIDLAQRETKNHSVYFAKSLVEELRSQTPLHRQPLRSAGFRVLKAPDVPSVLVELGYLSNRSDEDLMTSPAWRQKTARQVTAAVGRYFSTQIASGQ